MTLDYADVDALAQVIRIIDGNHDLGAGALAEALLASDWLAARDVATGAKALEDAAGRMGKRAREDRSASHWRAHAWSNWLRHRAAALRSGGVA